METSHTGVAGASAPGVGAGADAGMGAASPGAGAAAVAAGAASGMPGAPAQLAVFDFDGTSIAGNSPVLLVRHLTSRGMLKPSAVLRIVAWALAYKLRLPQNESWVRSLVFSAFEGRPAAEVDRFLADFYDDAVSPLFRPAADAAMREHARAGHVVVVISATFEPIILRAMQGVFEGGAIEEGEEAPAAAPSKSVSAAGSFETEITFTYCTEFIVGREKGNTRDPLRLRAYLESIGDCVVVVDDDDIIKVHVHTNDPGKALSEGVKYGQFETVKVENMRIQHANAAWVPEESAGPVVPQRAEPENEVGFVAVAAGEGLHHLFNDLGCESVVSGGQTMNPSTDDILNAIQATPAKVVYVLPNNKNIILAAEQAVPLADRKVHVLQTRTIPQGISAMLSFDPDASEEENLLNMMKAADNVSTGSITFAARNSDFGGYSIKEGEILALENGKVVFSDTDIHHATVKLAKSIINTRKITGKEVNFITIIYGQGMTEADAEAVRDAVQAKAGDAVDITIVDGGQPVYYYFLSVE